MTSQDTHHPQCGLLNLVDSVAQAKCEGWLLPMDKSLNLSNEKRLSEERAREARERMEKELQKERAKGVKEAAKAVKAGRRGKSGLRMATNHSRQQLSQ
jgi:hypothetical protein